MRRNNNQYKVGDKILVKRKKNSKDKLEFMGPFPITQINNNGTVHFQQVIFNDNTDYTSMITHQMITYQHLIFHFYDLPHPNHQGEWSVYYVSFNC